MVSRLAAFVIWAAIAASIVFWSMRMWVKPMAAPQHATLVAAASGVNGDLSRLFGADAPTPTNLPNAVVAVPADARFKLIGVVAPRSAGAMAEGLALIALDGKPAKAYRVGSAVDGELILQKVHARGASLGPQGQAAALSLELPILPAPATGMPVAGNMATPLPSGLAPLRAMPPTRQAQAAPPMEQPPVLAPQYAPVERAEEEGPSQRPIYQPPTSAGRPRVPL